MFDSTRGGVTYDTPLRATAPRPLGCGSGRLSSAVHAASKDGGPPLVRATFLLARFKPIFHESLVRLLDSCWPVLYFPCSRTFLRSSCSGRQEFRYSQRVHTSRLMQTLRILIADTHDVVRRWVRVALESQPGWTVCGEAKTGPETVAKTIEVRPDVVLLGGRLPGLQSGEITRE